jgi:tRNA uridine 5-carboxymethylaminomethyl modification enzyme
MALGCVGAARAEAYAAKAEALTSATELTRRLALSPTEAHGLGIQVNRDGVRRSAFELLSYPDTTWEQLVRAFPELSSISMRTAKQLETDAKYHVYLDRQRSEIETMRREEARALPVDLDYTRIAGLSNEVRTKLDQVRPRTLAQAARIEGMTPAALGLLLTFLKRSAA